jgi:dihydrofolate synthase / folylpolyglutamate synthase
MGLFFPCSGVPKGMNYQQAAAWLDRLQLFTIKLGLETTKTLLAELGTPQEQFQCIHIAGTNGKGSTGATLHSILSTAGYRTGFYSSPHLSCVRERFRIDDHFISETDFALLITRIATFLQGRPHPTYFECTTLLALLWFAEQRVDVAILETGMGGRLDATNVVVPLVSIITEISRDHEQHLGTTIAAIAGEKAGIVKSGVPVVFAGRASEAVPVIEDRCRQQQSALFLHGRDFEGKRNSEGGLAYQPLSGIHRPNLPLALRGDHQAINASLALAALELLEPVFPISPESLATGLQRVRWPGRMELLAIRYQDKQFRFLLDGAHNEAGVLALHNSLRREFPRRRLFFVWGNMADKALGAAFTTLLELADAIVFTQAESQRSAAPATLHEQCSQSLRAKARCAETVEQAMELIGHNAEADDLICVSGSLYLVGRVRQLLLGDDVS